MRKQRLWLGFLIIVGIWQLLHWGLDGRLIPRPFDAVRALVHLLISGELMIHSAYSLLRLTAAVMGALTIGSVSGIAMGMNRSLERVLAPLMYVMFPVPKAALLPVLFLLFGLGDISKIILLWLILYFQIALAVYDAVVSISQDVLISARALGLDRRQLYRHVVLPAVMPAVLSALRTSVGIGIAVLFFAETYATDRGLGYFIMHHWSLLNYEEMYAGILLLGGLGYVIFRGIDILKIKLIKWT